MSAIPELRPDDDGYIEAAVGDGPVTRYLVEPKAWGYDYNPSGTHQLLLSADAVYRRSNGQVTRIPRIVGARLAVW